MKNAKSSDIKINWVERYRDWMIGAARDSMAGKKIITNSQWLTDQGLSPRSQENHSVESSDMVSNPRKPTIVRCFADNGEHSHWKLVDSDTGKELWNQENDKQEGK